MSVSTIEYENDNENDVSHLIQIMREVYLGAMTPDSSDEEMDIAPVNRSESSMSYEADEPINKHLYFNDDGEEISRNEWLCLHWTLPLRGTTAVFRHPRVILQYLRFVDALNEAAGESEQLDVRFTEAEAQYILEHPSIVRPPHEFWDEVNELKWRLQEHIY